MIIDAWNGVQLRRIASCCLLKIIFKNFYEHKYIYIIHIANMIIYSKFVDLYISIIAAFHQAVHFMMFVDILCLTQ